MLFVSYYQKDDEKDVVFIYLLTQEGKILDEARVLVRFLDPCDYLIDPEGFLDSYFGYLKSIKLIVPNKITFRFADNFWELQVFEKPLYSYSLFMFDWINQYDEPILVDRPNWQYKTYFKFIMG